MDKISWLSIIIIVASFAGVVLYGVIETASPTITYGQGFLTDCNSSTSWSEVSPPSLSSTSLTVTSDDYFDIVGTASAASQSTYFEYDLTNLNPGLYDYALVRYKTSEASTGLGAKVTLVFSDGSGQSVLDTTFSTAWATAGVTSWPVMAYAPASAASRESW